MKNIRNLFRRDKSSTTSASNASTLSVSGATSSNTTTPDTTPYTRIGENINKDFCTVIVLLQQVFELIETEPDPKVLKEQSLRFIDYIDRCCDHSKITFKKRFIGYD